MTTSVSSSDGSPPPLEGLEVVGMAHGGDGVARHLGKTVFVTGAVPGDVVDARIVQRRGSFDRAVVDHIRVPSAERAEAPCVHFDECGGCQWQMARPAAQAEWKRQIVASQLRHIGGLEAEVSPVASVGPDFGYRNRMDFHLVDGRPGLSRAGSHRVVPLTRCEVLVEPLRDIFDRLRPTEGHRMTLRAGVGTGDSAVMVDDTVAVIHEVVAGVRFRITGRAFFQVNTGGAEALVATVSRALRPTADDVLLDGYAGGGLFAATVGRAAGAVVAVESGRRAVGDLRHNVPSARVVGAPMERAFGRIGPVDLAVVDPPRQGMGREVVSGLAAAGPRAVASVSCDPATFARDARLLVDAGFRITDVVPLDLFPHTFHVEVVGVFER